MSTAERLNTIEVLFTKSFNYVVACNLRCFLLLKISQHTINSVTCLVTTLDSCDHDQNHRHRQHQQQQHFLQDFFRNFISFQASQAQSKRINEHSTQKFLCMLLFITEKLILSLIINFQVAASSS